MFDIAPLIPYYEIIRTEYLESGGPVQVCAPNPNRATIYFAGGPNNNLILDITPNATSNHATIIEPGGGTYVLYWARDGILTTQAWYWYPQGAAVPLTVTEVIWRPPGDGS